MTHHICPFLYSFRIISRYLLWLSLVSSDVQSLFCFPRFSHFRSSCLNFARLSEIRARPMIDCRVSFENILDSLDYVIDLHRRISGLYSFHVQTPTEQHHLSLSEQLLFGIFVHLGISFANSPTLCHHKRYSLALYHVLSRYILSVSYVQARYSRYIAFYSGEILWF